MNGKPRILRPTADPAERALLVGDPGRALLLATELLKTPAPMFNHHRGLWGYCGPAADDSGRVMVQGTGVGGPSLNAVLTDLAELGVGRVVRLGTATSAELQLGSVLIASSASRPPQGPQSANGDLLRRAVSEVVTASDGAVISADIHLQPTLGAIPSPALAADLSTATLYEKAQALGVSALSILVVTESPAGRASDEEIERSMKAIAPIALKLLK